MRDGQPWSKNCRNWTRYECWLDLAAIRRRLNFAACVEDHDYIDTHMGSERGFICVEHNDAVIGDHKHVASRPIVR